MNVNDKDRAESALVSSAMAVSMIRGTSMESRSSRCHPTCEIPRPKIIASRVTPVSDSYKASTT